MSKVEDEEEAIGLLDQEDPLNEKPSAQPTQRRFLRFLLLPQIPQIPKISGIIQQSPLQLLGQCILFLLPSFVASAILKLIKRGEEKPVRPLRPTAYLDGLRGLAALAVFNLHISLMLAKDSGAGWAHAAPGDRGIYTDVYRFPLIQLLYKGNFSVSLFFVISGYVLSLSWIDEQNKNPRDGSRAMRKLASSILRRPFRLYLPAWISMILTFILVRLGYFTYFQSRNAQFSTLINGWSEIMKVWPARQPTLLAQVTDLFSETNHLFTIFTKEGYPHFMYNQPLWTIKSEFRASLVLFLTHGALFHVPKRERRIVLAGLVFLGLCTWSEDIPNFWAGYLIADFARSSPSPSKLRTRTMVISSFLLLLGAFIGSIPWDPDHTPMYSWFMPFNPFGWPEAFHPNFWRIIAAILVVSSLGNVPLAKRFYNLGVVQYLGKVSFSFYLVHFSLVQGYGMMLFYEVWTITGRDNWMAQAGGFIVAYILLLVPTIWVADLFWRCVDIPSTNVSVWIDKRLAREA